MRRILPWRTPGIVLVLGLVLLCSLSASTPLVVHAHPLERVTVPLVGQHGTQIDWAHPVRVARVPTHSGRDADLSVDTVPLYAPPKSGLAIQANFPSACYHTAAYYVIVNGQTSWSSTFGTLRATVWYLWCPTFAGDPVGINWSYGQASLLSGCGAFAVGNGLGAFISSTAGTTFDGEQRTTYSTCAGGYVWDDSLTVNGAGRYDVAMEAYDPATGKDAVAQSPCCY